MRRRWYLLAGGLLAGGGIAAAVLPLERGPSASRRAADRECERAYVTVPVRPAGTTLPRLTLSSVGSASSPTSVAWDPTDPARGVIGEREGRVVSLTGSVLIDLSDDTFKSGDGGLLAVEYSPDGQWLYVYRTTQERDERITVYAVRAGRPDASSERVVMDIDHPKGPQHHGGGLHFGPDGYLYISTGDGGGLGDPRGNGQKLSTLLGKLLRIEPTPAGPSPYRVPSSNPFVGRSGARPEIYAYGLRNPYRFTFDSSTGDLWLADVGHSCWEEVDWVPGSLLAGADFGWDHNEGTHVFQGGGSGDEVSPVHDYGHGDGWCVIVGGFVYRGRAVPALDGAYLYTDYCKGRVVALRLGADGAVALEDLGVHVDRPVALIEAPDGEPWVLSLEGEIERIVPRS